MKQNLQAWLFEGGMLGVPKRLMGLMEPLGMSFDDLGKMMYLLYCGVDQILPNDRYAQEAARTLHAKGLVQWYVDRHTVDFSPMFDKISQNLGEQPVYLQQEHFAAQELNYAELIKRFEREQGRFLTFKEKQDLENAVQRYHWSYELVYEMFLFHQKNLRRYPYDFEFFCKMVFGAKVTDKAGFADYVKKMDHVSIKVTEVLRRLGNYGNVTENHKETYLKWANVWKFSHEMILLAADENLTADKPSYKYTDSVLASWHEKGIMTPQDLAAYKTQSKNNVKSNQTRQENFQSKERDLNYLIE